jgi:phosphate/sulfate permease
MSFPGVAIVIIITVAILICALILTLGLVHYKRRLAGYLFHFIHHMDAISADVASTAAATTCASAMRPAPRMLRR